LRACLGTTSRRRWQAGLPEPHPSLFVAVALHSGCIQLLMSSPPFRVRGVPGFGKDGLILAATGKRLPGPVRKGGTLTQCVGGEAGRPAEEHAAVARINVRACRGTHRDRRAAGDRHAPSPGAEHKPQLRRAGRRRTRAWDRRGLRASSKIKKSTIDSQDSLHTRTTRHLLGFEIISRQWRSCSGHLAAAR
jgi:hypothetical protein